MLSEAQQKRVWDGMLGEEIRADYFAELAGIYLWRQRAATWTTLFLASSSVATLLADRVPPEWRLEFAIATTAVSLYSIVMQNQKLSVDAADLHASWNRLSTEYERVWENVYAEDAMSTLTALTERSIELSKSGTLFPNLPKKMLKWQKYVEEQRLSHTAS